ncbi:glycosyltransferase family 2 protein [Kordiimonas sp.]|uniref:glycosyltransferase family 2 protein n=1 Tax=Kordiimonas sp. TaxID=1970157 RepID=UPI003B518722
MNKRIHVADLPRQEYLDTLHVLASPRPSCETTVTTEYAHSNAECEPNWLFEDLDGARQLIADRGQSFDDHTIPQMRSTLVFHGSQTFTPAMQNIALQGAATEYCIVILAKLADLEFLDPLLGDEWIFLSHADERHRGEHDLAALCWFRDGKAQAQRPSFSVMTPLYNHGPFIEETLLSLRTQSYENWEVIVVNDGSTDDGPARVEKMAADDKRIHLINKGNGGVATALNRAIREANNEWIAWLSSDDLFLNQKLALHAALVRKLGNEKHVAFTNNLTFTTTAEDAIYPYPASPLQFATNDNLKVMMSARNIISGITPVVHRDLYLKAGEFDTSLKYTQDYDMWLKLLRISPFIYLPAATTATRLGPQQTANQQYSASRIEIITSYYKHLASIEPRHKGGTDRATVMDDVLLLVSAAANPRSFFTAIGMGKFFLEKAAELLRPFVDSETEIQSLKRQLFAATPTVPWSLGAHADINYLCDLLRGKTPINWSLDIGLSRVKEECSVEEIRSLLAMSDI